MMGCGFGNGHGSGSLSHVLGEMVIFVGNLASQILVILTSGPALGLLAAVVLLLAAMALLKVIFARRGPRPPESEGAK